MCALSKLPQPKPLLLRSFKCFGGQLEQFIIQGLRGDPARGAPD